MLCADAYVVHQGGRSFGPLGLQPGEESMRRLLRKHPGYHKLVADWIEADPLAPLRSAVLAACGDALQPISQPKSQPESQAGSTKGVTRIG